MPVLSGWLWWVYNYQTLATGVLAVVAAIVTALALRNQTNNQRKIAEEAARHRTKAAIAALIAEVKAMKHHLIKTKNGAIALAQPGWEQNPEYIRQFHAEIPDIFKYYYRDAVVIPVRTAAKIFDVTKQLTAINSLMGTSAVTDVIQRRHYKDIGDQVAALYDSVIAILDHLDRELDEEYDLHMW